MGAVSRIRFTAKALALLALAGAGAAAPSPRLERIATLSPPDEVAAASDVRWQEEGILLFGVGGNGVYSWQVGKDLAELEATLAGFGGTRFGRLQDYARVGGSESGIVAFSSSAHGVYHRDSDGTITSTKAIEVVGDLDRRHGKTVITGLSRRADGGWEDRLAWLISGDGTVRGILPRRDEESHWFLASSLGLARVLSEDRVLVIPGLEPDVFVYDWSGRLRDTVGTETLFADSPWRLDPERGSLLTDPPYFTAWLSRHRVIDEVLADDRGNIFFFVRHVPENVPYPARDVPSSEKRVTGNLTVVSGSGELTPVPLSDEKVEKLLELARKSGEGGNELTIPLAGELGEELDRILATPDLPRPVRQTKVCWDLVYAHMDDLQTVTKADCVVESQFGDARLRADLIGDRAVILLRGDTYGNVARVRQSEMFEARVAPPGR